MPVVRRFRGSRLRRETRGFAGRASDWLRGGAEADAATLSSTTTTAVRSSRGKPSAMRVDIRMYPVEIGSTGS
jgi:hypothetical protein